jgi:hypothetical protein
LALVKQMGQIPEARAALPLWLDAEQSLPRPRPALVLLREAVDASLSTFSSPVLAAVLESLLWFARVWRKETNLRSC